MSINKVLIVKHCCDLREAGGRWGDGYYHVNIHQKKANIATLISNEVNSKKKALLEMKGFVLIQEWVVSKQIDKHISKCK